jgi:hypothetical protein
MKKKDIITLTVAGVAFIICFYFLFTMLFPKKSVATTVKNTQTTSADDNLTKEIDAAALEKLNTLKDYGQADLNNVGRVNPFGPLN